jgi:hypothetical protein
VASETEMRHELEQLDVELDTLWCVVFGDQPRPTRRRRALARLWAAAMTVDWHRSPRAPVGFEVIEGGRSTPPADL